MQQSCTSDKQNENEEKNTLNENVGHMHKGNDI